MATRIEGMRRQVPVEVLAEIVVMSEEGFYNDDIAEKLNVSINTVTRYRRYLGLV